MATGLGYFIRNTEYISVTTHIAYIISHPMDFGLNIEEIHSTYGAHGETVGTEGKAREEIIKIVSKGGWIRVRQYLSRTENYWTIQFDRWEVRKKDVIRFLEWTVFNQKIMVLTDTVQLTGFFDNYFKDYNYKTGGIKKIFTSKTLTKSIFTS